MVDALEQQFINETLDLMRKLNDKYKDFYHFKVLTVVPMQEDSCENCKEDQVKKCLRLAIEGHDVHRCGDPSLPMEQLMDNYAPTKEINEKK
jgi:hypothetical protein